MTSSTDRWLPSTQARRALFQLERSLNDLTLTQRIDHPVDQALQRFRFNRPHAITPASVHEVTAQLVQTLHQGIGSEVADVRVAWGRVQAHDLLHSVPAQHYEQLLLTAADDPEEGIDELLVAVAEAFKARCHRQLQLATLARIITPLGFEVRAQLADLLRRRYGEHLPHRLQHWPAGLLVPQIPALLEMQQQVDRQLQNMLSDPIDQLP